MTTALRQGLLLALALAAPLAAQPVITYENVSGAEHQAQFDTLSRQGYRVLSLSTYGSIARLQYAAIWIKRKGPIFLGFHGLTEAAYQQLLDANCGTFTPTILTAAGPADDARFAGVLEKTGEKCVAMRAIDQTQLGQAVGAMRDQGLRIATLDAYGDKADTRFVVAFEPNDAKIGWGYLIGYGASGHQTMFDTMRQAFARQVSVGINDDASIFASVWHDTVVGTSIARHDMLALEYTANLALYEQKYGYYPIHVNASGTGLTTRFAAIWAATDLPAGRVWSTRGPDVPELAAFDTWAQQYMQATATRAASLAVVKDARLVLTRGYTWAESGYPVAHPDSLYRLASTSKPLTSIAVHQQMALDPELIAYDSTMAGYFGNPEFEDPRADSIRVLHLLTHTGGWDRKVGNKLDPTFMDATIASALGVSIPISTNDVRTYMQGQPLEFAPGTESRYSNYGYSLLGRILQALNPTQNYDQVLQGRLFAPLGITRAVIGGAHLSERLPNEVLYHPSTLGVAQSVNEAARPWVPDHYGGSGTSATWTPTAGT